MRKSSVAVRETGRLLDEALERRTAFIEGRAGTDAWRIVNGSADGMLGLTADRLGDLVLVEAHRVNADPMPLVAALMDRLGGRTPIFLKERWSPRAVGAQVSGAPASARVVVREEGISFAVSLVGSEHIGLFLDSRPARRMVGRLASGARVLNLFSYTGAFGVAAAARGARSTVNVDTKRSALERARENYRLNGAPFDTRTFTRSDAARYVARAVSAGARFDIAVLDPPPRYDRPGRAKYRSETGFAPLAARCVTAIVDGGLLIAGLNDPGIDDARFEELIALAARTAGRDVAVERRVGPGPDFPAAPEQPVARFWACRVG